MLSHQAYLRCSKNEIFETIGDDYNFDMMITSVNFTHVVCVVIKVLVTLKSFSGEIEQIMKVTIHFSHLERES